jgi:uncharacterized protein
MKTVLITGASSGIGEAFARKLATQKENLLLVARSEDRLASICNELRQAHKISADYIAIDLTKPDSPQKIFEETNRRGLEIETLINNAGFGSLGAFTEQKLERELEMIDLNIKALVALTHLYLRPMREQRRGAIINVASTAAFQPVPFFATYSATKAFVLSFSVALWEENRPFGIKVMALCPGVTETRFFEASNIERPPFRGSQTPEEVVDTALRGLRRGKSHIISGWHNLIPIRSGQLVPRSLIARFIGKIMRPRFE